MEPQHIDGFVGTSALRMLLSTISTIPWPSPGILQGHMISTHKTCGITQTDRLLNNSQPPSTSHCLKNPEPRQTCEVQSLTVRNEMWNHLLNLESQVQKLEARKTPIALPHATP
jgi:hypothetical protein